MAARPCPLVSLVGQVYQAMAAAAAQRPAASRLCVIG